MLITDVILIRYSIQLFGNYTLHQESFMKFICMNAQFVRAPAVKFKEYYNASIVSFHFVIWFSIETLLSLSNKPI